MLAKGWIQSDLTYIDTAGAPAQAGGDPDDRGAIWNYIMLVEAKTCGGVHNPAYGNAVLDATLEYVQSSAKNLP